MGAYGNLLDQSPPDEPYIEVDESRATVLIYTSGTTSQPKGVALTLAILAAQSAITISRVIRGESG